MCSICRDIRIYSRDREQGHVKYSMDRKVICVVCTGTWEIYQGQGNVMCSICRDIRIYSRDREQGHVKYSRDREV